VGAEDLSLSVLAGVAEPLAGSGGRLLGLGLGLLLLMMVTGLAVPTSPGCLTALVKGGLEAARVVAIGAPGALHQVALGLAL
jgi:hypothetical protein